MWLTCLVKMVRFADRDMFMRFRGGGVGHMYMRQVEPWLDATGWGKVWPVLSDREPVGTTPIPPTQPNQASEDGEDIISDSEDNDSDAGGNVEDKDGEDPEQPEEEEDLEEDEDDVRNANVHAHLNGNGVDNGDEAGDEAEYSSNMGL